MALADCYSTIEELLASDENELNELGITNPADRSRLLEQAHLLTNKLGDSQTTRLNSSVLSKSSCNLSPAMLSRISLNDRPTSVIYPYEEPTSEIRKRNFGHLMEPEEKVLTVDDNGKIQTRPASLLSSSPLDYQGVLKKVPSTSVHGLRTTKSLSIVGTDRLKLLDSSTSLFQRQTSLISKKVTNLANKLVNPFALMKKKIEPSVDSEIDLRTNMKRQVSIIENNNDITITSQRTVTITPLKRTRE
ncbi:unnamed protein product, partial [Rotaria magnacalcarata]